MYQPKYGKPRILEERQSRIYAEAAELALSA
jgi:hypothetical protein